MTRDNNTLIDRFIESVSEHSFKHRDQFRDERSNGRPNPQSKSRGAPLNIVEKDNFRQRLSDPNTRCFIDGVIR